jgi:hypothetical protein
MATVEGTVVLTTTVEGTVVLTTTVGGLLSTIRRPLRTHSRRYLRRCLMPSSPTSV